MPLLVDQSTIDEVAAQVAADLMFNGAATFELQPGNGCRYAGVIATTDGGRCVVALPDYFAASWLCLDGGFHPSYVAEKLRLLDGDAAVMASFLNAISAAVRP